MLCCANLFEIVLGKLQNNSQLNKDLSCNLYLEHEIPMVGNALKIAFDYFDTKKEFDLTIKELENKELCFHSDSVDGTEAAHISWKTSSNVKTILSVYNQSDVIVLSKIITKLIWTCLPMDHDLTEKVKKALKTLLREKYTTEQRENILKKGNLQVFYEKNDKFKLKYEKTSVEDFSPYLIIIATLNEFTNFSDVSILNQKKSHKRAFDIQSDFDQTKKPTEKSPPRNVPTGDTDKDKEGQFAPTQPGGSNSVQSKNSSKKSKNTRSRKKHDVSPTSSSNTNSPRPSENIESNCGTDGGSDNGSGSDGLEEIMASIHSENLQTDVIMSDPSVEKDFKDIYQKIIKKKKNGVKKSNRKN